MSAFATLQTQIAAKLAATHAATIGDGALKSFPLAHGFGSKAMYATVTTAGGDPLVEGTDFSLAPTSADIVTLTTLGADPLAADAWNVKLNPLRKDATAMGDAYVAGTIPIVTRRSKEKANDIDAAFSLRTGLCILVTPPWPTQVMRGAPFLFFEKAEVNVVILEQPNVNATGIDAWDLLEDCMSFLHWQMFPNHAHPMECGEPRFDDGNVQISDARVKPEYTRIFSAVFTAHFGLRPQPNAI